MEDDFKLDGYVTIEDCKLRYAIADKETGEYLNDFDCPDNEITNAFLYDSFENATEALMELDVSYLYEVVCIEITHKLLNKT